MTHTCPLPVHPEGVFFLNKHPLAHTTPSLDLVLSSIILLPDEKTQHTPAYLCFLLALRNGNFDGPMATTEWPLFGMDLFH